MINHSLSGLGTALITPFLPDGEVDYKSLALLVEQQITDGVDYLVVLGTTAEAVTLSEEEKRKVISTIVAQTANRVPLVLGLGGNCTRAVVEKIKNTDLSDFAAILSVCPYYNKPNQEGMFRHFEAIAQLSPIPVILYNVPGRTGVNLLPQTVIRLRKAFPHKISGIKEASGNIEQIKTLINLRQTDEATKDLLVISGDDGITAQLMKAGADGLISVAANEFTKDFSLIVHSPEQSFALQDKYTEMVRLLFAEGNPTGIKAVLSLQNKCENILRLPLVSASDSLMKQIKCNIKILKQSV